MTKVLAKVKNYEITEEMLNETVALLSQQQGIQVASEEDKKHLLDELIARQLIVEDALENKLTETEEFQKAYRDLVLQFSLSNLFKTANVSEEELKAYYDENQSQFSEATIRAAHILVETEEEAASLLNEIKNGTSFEALAAEHSKCPSGARGGDLGEFGRGQMVPEFEMAAFDLNVGEISDIVKTQFGYHIIKLLDRNEVVPFDAVKQQIQQYLASKKQNDLYSAFTQGLKSKYSVEKF